MSDHSELIATLERMKLYVPAAGEAAGVIREQKGELELKQRGASHFIRENAALRLEVTVLRAAMSKP